MHGAPLTDAQFQAIALDGAPVIRGLFIFLAAVVGGWLLRRDAKSWPFEKSQRLDLMVVVVTGSLVGAAIPSHFAGGLIQEMSLHGLFFGPNTIIGGLIGGFMAASGYKRVKGLKYDTSDDFVLGTMAAMAIGRVGCHFGHCCIGRGSDAFLAMDFGDNINRLPIQLIEATLMSSLFILFWGLHRRGDFAGRRLFLFMMAYGIVRFVMEFYRAPIAINVVGIGSYQWLAAALFLLGLHQLVRRRPSFEHQTIKV